MQLTQLEIQREVARAKREGRWGDVEELEILLAAIAGAPAAAPEPAETYVLQEGDDPFGVAERELGVLSTCHACCSTTRTWADGGRGRRLNCR